MEMDVVTGTAMTMRVWTRWGATVHVPRFSIDFRIGFMRVRMHLAFGTTDLEGVYRLKVTVWDQIRGTSSTAETSFTLTR